jgi:hypothetical protein
MNKFFESDVLPGRSIGQDKRINRQPGKVYSQPRRLAVDDAQPQIVPDGVGNQTSSLNTQKLHIVQKLLDMLHEEGLSTANFFKILDFEYCGRLTKDEIVKRIMQRYPKDFNDDLSEDALNDSLGKMKTFECRDFITALKRPHFRNWIQRMQDSSSLLARSVFEAEKNPDVQVNFKLVNSGTDQDSLSKLVLPADEVPV